MNDAAKQFAHRYPNSERLQIVQKLMTQKQTLSNFSFSASFGAYSLNFENGMSNTFSPGFSIGVELSAIYKNWEVRMPILFFPADVLQEFNHEGTWERDSSSWNSNLSLVLGRRINIKNRLVITPYAGWGYQRWQYDIYENEELVHEAIFKSNNAILGTSIDLAFSRTVCRTDDFNSLGSHYFLRIDFANNITDLTDINPDFTGNFSYLGLAFGVNFRDFKRKQPGRKDKPGI